MIGRCLLALAVHSGLLAAPVAAAGNARHPIVKWGQKPDRLYITVLITKESGDPEIKMEEKRLRLKATDAEMDLKLLRKINVTESKYEVNAWSVQFDLRKARSEPCWKRLLKAEGTPPGWLKKDTDRIYLGECQYAKESWREAYFRAKLEGDNAPSPPSSAEEDSEHPAMPPDQDQAQKAWEKTIKAFRDRAVPRNAKAKEKQKGRRKSSAAKRTSSDSTEL
mmetsp:Transcript_5405/g.11964  ORF Transcript_5405/g.11964 Transcript_5405/m.11964 type:complete len:222 (-) Transcript_5405:16-681(-)